MLSLKTPLYDWHKNHGAKMVEFGGWLLPVSYEGVLSEHQAVRERCGLFDISHMGEIFVEGEDAAAFLQYLTTNDVSKLKDGAAQYSLLLNAQGYVLDDIIVYRLKPDKYLLCVNASNTEKAYQWIRSQAKGRVEIKNRSAAMGMVALQGPASAKVLAKLGIDLQPLDRFHFLETSVASAAVIFSRTGYTGEEGAEFFLEGIDLSRVWEALLQAGEAEGIRPIGLGARDTLRLEMGYPLYGHELSESIHPLEAGLGWVVKMDKGEFVGRGALESFKTEGIARRLIGLTMQEPGIPRQGLNVLSGGSVRGQVLSGTYSPSLQVGIATALVEKGGIEENGEIFIDIRGKMKKAKSTKLPFLKK